MIKFRKVSGKHVNPISHTAEMLKKKRISALHIGTDSQRHQKSIVYVTAIAYRYKNKGVHYIYNKLNHKPIKDDWPRLWLETEYTMEVAKLLKICEWELEKISNWERDNIFNAGWTKSWNNNTTARLT